MKKLCVIIGARPQFIKHFAFERAAKNRVKLITIHTGQHYDENMSEVFFEQLDMKQPTYILQHGGGSHGYQTGHMMIDIEKIMEVEKPDGVVVYGDTNSTLAGSVVAAKLNIPLFHIEAGLRSFNKEMPEEINRILTDHVSELLFVPSNVALGNLYDEGIRNGVHLVGDIMKDLVLYVLEHKLIGERKYAGNYYYATIHRPYNTDKEDRLKYILNSLNSLSKKVILSIHPRTNNLINRFGIEIDQYSNIIVIEPQGYFDNLNYLHFSDGVVTDSGGMQKEAYWLEKKCITIRKETEWVETVDSYANKLLFYDISTMDQEFSRKPNLWNQNLYGDGNTANNIIDLILDNLNKK